MTPASSRVDQAQAQKVAMKSPPPMDRPRSVAEQQEMSTRLQFIDQYRDHETRLAAVPQPESYAKDVARLVQPVADSTVSTARISFNMRVRPRDLGKDQRIVISPSRNNAEIKFANPLVGRKIESGEVKTILEKVDITLATPAMQSTALDLTIPDLYVSESGIDSVPISHPVSLPTGGSVALAAFHRPMTEEKQTLLKTQGKYISGELLEKTFVSFPDDEDTVFIASGTPIAKCVLGLNKGEQPIFRAQLPKGEMIAIDRKSFDEKYHPATLNFFRSEFPIKDPHALELVLTPKRATDHLGRAVTPSFSPANPDAPFHLEGYADVVFHTIESPAV